MPTIPPDALKSLIAALTTLVAMLGSYQSPGDGGSPDKPTTPITAPPCPGDITALPVEPTPSTPETNPTTLPAPVPSTLPAANKPGNEETAGDEPTTDGELDTSGKGATDPTDPAHPATPANPAAPADPAEPADPAKPSNPGDCKPTTPPGSTEPTEPAPADPTAPPADPPAAPGGPGKEICGKTNNVAATGGYEVQTNLWNSSGDICLNVAGNGDYKVTKSTVAEGNKNDKGEYVPGGYPNIGTTNLQPIAVDKLGNASTSWTIVAPEQGKYNASYDVWFHPEAAKCGGVITDSKSVEIMIWLKHPGMGTGQQPLAQNETIGGRAYNVSTFTGPTGQTALIYEMVTPVNSVKDLKLAPIAQDAVKRGKLSAAGSLCRVQAGFEIHNNIPALESKGFSFKAN